MCHRFWGVLLLIPVSIASANTGSTNFIQQRAQDPITFQTGIPEAASRLHTPSELQLSIVHNNVFMGGLATSERLILDGESSQFNLRYRRKLNDCWQVNVSGVWLAHTSGQFDNVVNDWHQFFGLPDAQRGDWPSNQLEYVYENETSSQRLTEDVYGWGDAQLQLQHSLGCADNAPVFRAGVKLPVGEPAFFFGNGAVDTFLDVQSSWRKWRPASRWSWAASIGMVRTGKQTLITGQEPVVGFGVAGFNFSLNPNVQLLGQLDWHTPLYKSDLRELGDFAVQLSLGVRYQSHAKGTWEISFSEDAVIDTSPDIVVRLAWVSKFDALPFLE